MLRERSQRYQSILGGSPTDAVPQQGQVPGVQTTAAPTTQVSPVSQQPSEFPSTKFVTRAGTELIGVPNFAAGERYVDDKLNQQFQPVSGQTPSGPQLVDPANVQKATRLRAVAQQATLEGDTATATLYNNEANRIDPPESITFRDGMAFSSKRGILGRFTEYKRLTKEEIAAEGLPDNKIWQRGPDNRIYAVEGSDVTPQLNKKQLIESLPTLANNVYPTLKPRFDALIKRAPGLTAEQINSDLVSILDADSKIREELDPTLFQQGIKRTVAGRPQNIINLSDPAKRAQALSENSSRYTQNKNVSESFEVATRYNNFVQAYNNPAAAGASDAVLIYSMAKMLDPGGAVQQGDIGTISGQKSIPDKLKSIHQQFINSRLLSDDQRKDLNAMAYSLMKNKQKALTPVIKQYRNYAADLQSPDPEVDVQDPFTQIELPKNRVVTINGKRTEIRLGVDPNGVKGYYYTAPNGKTYPYQD
jgi:hypothetical protein